LQENDEVNSLSDNKENEGETAGFLREYFDLPKVKNFSLKL